ncbi:hypothetical protein FNL55_11335 [Tardiphaga sp. vice352]|uniref:hypothetical protein n=1 Tax=unclassified Tardiphaga TaxID=2631404 RepID=UPI0011650C19|nr:MULTISPECIES: hypothetical protein [unclassified Tardiphaga]QDM16570.1 hypothetical protein FNL53_12030 [Tardiphaga sp. vice278]QDM21595.1 hypothetical protein FIU28_10920 [Tardiphaga sp. vice154]QDM26781.1 hypothetical protein FNL56_12195 [Tardiphaga sp. vice304]QDM31844.1 hypothetical protein FNL55_11335 [Tardiphaga sp. vice352]
MTVYAEAIAGLFAFSLLLLFLFGPWQQTATDFARQIVFERRDQWFDLAHAGHIDFDSTEYRQVRDALNSLIRFAHELTLTRFIFAIAAGETEGPSESSKAIRRIVDEYAQGEARRIMTEARQAMFAMVALKSPLFLLVAAVIGTYALLIGGLTRFLNLFSGVEHAFGEQMEAEAESA